MPARLHEGPSYLSCESWALKDKQEWGETSGCQTSIQFSTWHMLFTHRLWQNHSPHGGTYPEGPRLVFSSSEGWKFCVCSLGPRNHSLSSLNSTLLSPQDTADYVKPVAFSVEYSLEDPDNGPMLDNGWPTTLRVSVRPTPLSP